MGLVAAVNLPAVAERLASVSRPTVSGTRPNVLLVVLDTVRASNLSLYGYDRQTTPRLDTWAGTGTVFERGLSASPWTLPAHATMFTGRYHFELGTGPSHPLGGSVPTLAQVLSDRGYATAGFAANPGYTTLTSGLGRGFDRYQAQRLSLSSILGSSWLSGSLLNLAGVEDDKGWKTGGQVTDEFLGWLGRRDADRPFFAFLNYFDAHDPYDAPEPYGRMFGPPAWDGPLSDLNDQWRQFSERFGRAPDDPEVRRQLSLWMNQYDGAIAYIDHQLGVIHDALDARGLLDDTLVVVVGDHGEHWGEHGLIEHGVSLYVSSLHVPLVISLPGVVPAGARVAAPVTLRDLPSTILALAGFAGDAALPGHPMFSGSGVGPGAGEGSVLLAELEPQDWHRFAPFETPILRGAMTTLFEGDLQYILNGDGVEELYDVVSDPEEREELSTKSEFGPDLARFRSILEELDLDAGEHHRR